MPATGPATAVVPNTQGTLFVEFVKSLPSGDQRMVADVCTAAAFMGIADDRIEADALLAVDELEHRFHARPEIWSDLRLAMRCPGEPAADAFRSLDLKLAAVVLAYGEERARRLLNEAQERTTVARRRTRARAA